MLPYDAAGTRIHTRVLRVRSHARPQWKAHE